MLSDKSETKLPRESDNYKTDVGSRVQEIRLGNKLTQTEMGEVLGMAHYNVSNMENGRSLPSVSTLVLISQHFGISLDWLITGAGSRESGKQFADNAKMTNASGGALNYATFSDVPMIPVKARASFVESLQQGSGFSNMEQKRVYDVEEKLLKKNPVVIEIDGDSMEPQLKAGMEVLAVPVDRSNYAYQSSCVVAVVFLDYFLVKRIKSNTLMQDGTLMLHSDKDDSTLIIKGEDIYGMWRIEQSLPFKIV